MADIQSEKIESADAKSPVDQPQEDILEILKQATEGLLFPSETDAPLTPFVWTDVSGEATPENVLAQADKPAETPIDTTTLSAFFKPTTTEEDWHNDEEKEDVRRFRELVTALKDNLKSIKVYKLGETKMDVYIVGKTSEGSLAGVRTQVVET
jgi:hypothetical protein